MSHEHNCHIHEVGPGPFCPKAHNVKFFPNALLFQRQFDVALILCNEASQTLQGLLTVYANYVARPQTTDELAKADITAVTKFCVTLGIFKVLGKCQTFCFSDLF